VDGAADFSKKYRQLEKRVKAHVLVAFLGYALELTLKHLLKRSGSEYSAPALKRLAELRSVDFVLPTRRRTRDLAATHRQTR
jgi:hypothetical protein